MFEGTKHNTYAKELALLQCLSLDLKGVVSNQDHLILPVHSDSNKSLILIKVITWQPKPRRVILESDTPLGLGFLHDHD